MEQDKQIDERKKDHIHLAFDAQVSSAEVDERFFYEPLFGKSDLPLPVFSFLGKELQLPIWVSSMTGGTEKAHKINHNLAKACAHFKMGMGLGSCRPLLESDDRWEDFDLRNIMGEDVPFYANLGIAQVEQLLRDRQVDKINNLVRRLRVDGLIVHVNPLQEWLQPEGDKLLQTPIETITQFLDEVNIPLIVKEVGQGMGKRSLESLMQLPLRAIEFAAHGGTNFSKLELLRSAPVQYERYQMIAKIGHTTEQMIGYVNQILEEKSHAVQCKNFIISGGVKNFLDGYYNIRTIHGNAVYGQASTLLKYAAESYESLAEYLESQKEGLKLAYAYLQVNEKK